MNLCCLSRQKKESFFQAQINQCCLWLNMALILYAAFLNISSPGEFEEEV